MNILYINACVRKNSRTNELAQFALNKLAGNIEEINLIPDVIIDFSIPEATFKILDFAKIKICYGTDGN